MIVWRLAKAAHSQLDGAGGLYGPGRCNHKGFAVVYCAESVALATVELRAHLKTAPLDYVLIEVWIPDEIQVQDAGSLPDDWRDNLTATRDLGTAWLQRGASIVLRVPSAVVPFDRNYLLNPAHPDYRLIEVRSVRPFRFDPRLYETAVDPSEPLQ